MPACKSNDKWLNIARLFLENKTYMLHHLSNLLYFTISTGKKSRLFSSYSYSLIVSILFLSYINDLPNSSKILKVILFADDTNVFCSHSSLLELKNIINLELKSLVEFISAISIAPLQVLYYSEALPTTARILYRSFTPKRIGNCR